MMCICFFVQLLIAAYDSGNPEEVVHNRLTINVTRNENQPRFSEDEYNINIIDSTPLGSAIEEFIAVDRDVSVLKTLKLSDNCCCPELYSCLILF